MCVCVCALAKCESIRWLEWRETRKRSVTVYKSQHTLAFIQNAFEHWFCLNFLFIFIDVICFDIGFDCPFGIFNCRCDDTIGHRLMWLCSGVPDENDANTEHHFRTWIMSMKVGQWHADTNTQTAGKLHLIPLNKLSINYARICQYVWAVSVVVLATESQHKYTQIESTCDANENNILVKTVNDWSVRQAASVALLLFITPVSPSGLLLCGLSFPMK